MKLQELAFGLERELGKHLAMGARYIHKQIDTAIEDVGQLDADGNEIYTIGNPGFGDAVDVFLADGTARRPTSRRRSATTTRWS